ncbi:BQ2448_1071 [Microbotryum intermedium]|uniref:BQ2448_1071 protein n=1 Tax=Microbotryum intermedium TaxID=269621 RepID=A0A238F959_9BASI|nr:BQ2448_1071 [Microbotryum intermedium]
MVTAALDDDPHRQQASTSNSGLPQIDYSALGTVGVVGSFAGLQFYDPTQSVPTYSSAVSTFVARNASGTFTKIGETNSNGSIQAICQTSFSDGRNVVFLGGQFTTIGGVTASNIAVYDPSNHTFSALGQGLQPVVTALACNSTVVIAGGSFQAPVGAATTAGFAGYVAQWSISNQSWAPPPFAGLDGPIETIVPSSDGKSIFFGGNFNTTFSTVTKGPGLLSNSTNATTASTTTFASLGSSLAPISLNQSDYEASPTTYMDGFGKPENIFCPRHGDGVGASWLLVDGTVGFFIVRTYKPLQARGVRLGNTFYEGRGTKTFSFVSIPDNQVLTLTYASDPRNASSALTTCSTSCPLAHDTDVPYQDFLFPEGTELTGFQLNLLEHYGPGAGLHLLQLLSDGAFAYAVESQNTVTCTSGLGASQASTVSTTGVWNEAKAVSSEIPGTILNVLISVISAGTKKYHSPTITWKPYVPQTGLYSVYLDTPGCQIQGNCPNRLGAVGVYVSPFGFNVTANTNYTSRVIKTEVDQRNAQDAQVLIYQGPLVASALSNTSLEVTICLGDMGAPTDGSTYDLVANLVTLVAASTDGNVSALATTVLTPSYGLYEYVVGTGPGAFGDVALANETQTNATSTLTTNATIVDRVASRLGAGAVVNAIVSVGTADTARLFLGGSFTFNNATSNTTNLTSANVMEYTKASGIVAAPNGGLDGVVTSLLELDGVLYAAGTFNQTTDGQVKSLQGLAQWAYTNTSATWSAVGTSLPSSFSATITQLAVTRDPSTNSSEIVLVGPSGIVTLDPSSGVVNSTGLGLVVGSISAFASPIDPSNSNGSTYFAGSLVAVTGETSPSGSFLTRGSDGSPQLTPFDYSFTNASTTTTSSTSSNATTTSQAASSRLRRSNSRDLVAMAASLLASRAAADVVTALPADLSGLSSTSDTNRVVAGTFWQNGSTQYAVLGGHFTTASQAVNVGLYNAKNKTFAPLPGLTIDGTVGALEVVGDVLWIGGNFTTSARSGVAARQGLTSYQLKSQLALDQPPALMGTFFPCAVVPSLGYTGQVPIVRFITQRPGFASQVIVAGAFASAGAVPSCQSICSWDTTTLQWSPLSGGLQGIVGSVAFAGDKAEFLYAGGDFILNGATTYFAQWTFTNSSWQAIGSSLPGPVTAVSTDDYNQNKVFVAGSTSSTGAPYVWYYNGQTWTDINNGTISAPTSGQSGIQQLVFLPLSQARSANSIVESNRLLLVSGSMSINNTVVASALYDGAKWYPYLLATATTGAGGSIAQLFYSLTSFSLAMAHHLSVGLVILISIAIALGVVFLLVLIGLLIALARRRDEERPNHLHDEAASAESIKRDGGGGGGVRRPTDLLATVGAATAVLLDSSHEKSRSAAAGTHSEDNSSGGGVEALAGAGALSYDSHGYDEGDEPLGADSTARARYSFTAEHPGELSVSAGEDLTVLENGDPNWFLVANSSGQRGLMPASYLA